MTTSTAELDEWIELLNEEVKRLNALHKGWADHKARKLEKMREFLRRSRQDIQMTGVGGRRIE